MTFTIGVALTATTVGAVHYASAASDVAITACANKKTGAMRYLSKGACKKSETSLLWNQMGPQGVPGAEGKKGDSGISTNGTNGQNLHAIDDQNQDLGIITEASWNGVTVLSAGGLWTWSTYNYEGQNAIQYFRNSDCTIPLGVIGLNQDPFDPNFKAPTQLRYVLQKSATRTPTAAYAVTGQAFDLQTLTTVYEWNRATQTCVAQPGSYFGAETWIAFDLVQVALPSYTPPIRIVQK